MKLDLHGMKHSDVELTVERFIMNHSTPLSIITGFSDRMRDLVITVVKRYQMRYEVPSHNAGMIIVTEKLNGRNMPMV